MHRRTLLLGGLGLGGLLVAGQRVPPAGPAGVAGAGTSAPSGGAMLDRDPVSHLVRRVAPAPTAALAASVRATGVSAWLADQLQPGQVPQPSVLTRVLADLPTETLDLETYVARQREARAARRDDATAPRDGLPPAAELAASVLLRRILGNRHLEESLTELWGDLLHVHVGHDAATQVLTPFLVRDVLRPGALGAFDDLLVAVTTSPAMLAYLDGARSRAGAVNENHARELLELHTVGVDAHDEDDVAAVARVLTGWVVVPATGVARFVPARHDDGVAEAVGWTGSGTVDDLEDLLRHLARRPATANRVARALAVRFVADDPPAELVRALADRYLAADTAIAPVIEELLGSDAFTTSVGAKLRRPIEYLSAAVAATAMDPGEVLRGPLFRSIATRLVALGHTPHGWPAPDGYPDVAGAWVSSAAALGRWSLASDVARASHRDRDPAAAFDEVAAAMLLAPPPPDLRALVLATAAGSTEPGAAAAALALDLPAAHLR